LIKNIEKLLVNGNLRYQRKILQGLENIEVNDEIPKYPVLILTCIDPRIDVYRIFQLNPGDVFILRNAGNVYTQDTLRSILLTVYQYNIKNIIILGHLDCGMTKINLLELKRKIPFEFLSYKSKETTDLFSKVNDFFKPFIDELKNIKQQVDNLQRLHMYKTEVEITGMLYDVETGWIFEYDKFKKFATIENFRKLYTTILREKKYQFIDFIETIENEIINNDELEKIMSDKDSSEVGKDNLYQLVDEKEEIFIYTENDEENDSSVKIQNHKLDLDERFNVQRIMPRIQVPNINFPRVKIHIPKISRKKNES